MRRTSEAVSGGATLLRHRWHERPAFRPQPSSRTPRAGRGAGGPRHSRSSGSYRFATRGRVATSSSDQKGCRERGRAASGRETHALIPGLGEGLGLGATLLATAPPRLGLALVAVTDGLGQTVLELLDAQPKVTAHGRQAAGPKQHRQDDDDPQQL